MPSSVKDRLTNTYEHIFHFVKARRYYYDLDAIREPHKSVQTPTKEEYKQILGKSWHDHKDDLVKGQRIWRGKDIGHPLGKNPGDVFTKHDIAVGRIHGKLAYTDPLHTKPYHPLGKNPHRMRLQREKYIALDPSKPMDLSHPKGKNPGDFWSIPTKPFKGAHFSVYPEAICVKPIKSSCPQWVCKKCGKPRERLTKRKGEVIQQWGVRRKKPWFKDKREMPQKIIKEGIYETIGWSDCGCNAGFEPGIVLDPMCGSGTTLVVAKKLGRRFIGMDINPQYCEMARKRLASVPAKLDEWLNG